jgi:hypothetical protein
MKSKKILRFGFDMGKTYPHLRPTFGKLTDLYYEEDLIDFARKSAEIRSDMSIEDAILTSAYVDWLEGHITEPEIDHYL